MRSSIWIIAGLAMAGCSGDAAVPPKIAPRTMAPRVEQKAEIEPVVKAPSASAVYPSPDTWEQADDQQRQRAARSLVQLKALNVPAFSGPLFVDSDEQVSLQLAPDVARRVLVLWAVELRGEGVPQAEALGLIEKHDLWESVSPEEKRFLEDKDPDLEESQDLIWRLESIWVLLWALGHVDELIWPSEMCDVEQVVALLKPLAANPDFITGATLRSKAEILDAQDLTMRIEWAIRDARLNRGGMIPSDLDWSQDYNLEHVTQSSAARVVAQRHYALNWLVKFLDPKDWDHVDTPT